MSANSIFENLGIEQPIESFIDVKDSMANLERSLELYHSMIMAWSTSDYVKMNKQTASRGLDLLFDSVRLQTRAISQYLSEHER